MNNKSQFLFFNVIEGNEDLLKEEIKEFFPHWHLSFSTKGFLTFKNTGAAVQISNFQDRMPLFCLRSGENLGKCSQLDIDKKAKEIAKHYNFSNYDIQIIDDDCFDCQKATLGNYLITFYKIKNDYWIGLSYITKKINPFCMSDPQVEELPDLPSRAYFKVAQACEVFDLDFKKDDFIIEFGSAPGGTSLYLLNKSMNVVGVDPAVMDDVCLDHKRFTHLKLPIQEVRDEDLPNTDVAWITVDLNLNPKQSIKEVLRLCDQYRDCLKGILFTIKIVKPYHAANIRRYEKEFLSFGAKEVTSMQLPSHKKEILIYSKFY